MNKPIVFITGNANKAQQLAKYLQIPVEHQKLELDEIQSLDLAEVIAHKAREAFRIIGKPVIVDDVSLTISAMGKLPGPFIKYFIQELGTAGICAIVSGLVHNLAIAEVCVGYFDGEHLEVCKGVVSGSISDQPRGTGGFGWDALFIPDGYSHTRAEMEEEDYDNTSPRKAALEQLRVYLASLG